MAAYLEACLEEAGDEAAFIAKALGDIARAKGMAQVAWREMPAYLERAHAKRFLGSGVQGLTLF